MNKYKCDSFQCVIHYDFLLMKIKIIKFVDWKFKKNLKVNVHLKLYLLSESAEVIISHSKEYLESVSFP